MSSKINSIIYKLKWVKTVSFKDFKTTKPRPILHVAVYRDIYIVIYILLKKLILTPLDTLISTFQQLLLSAIQRLRIQQSANKNQGVPPVDSQKFLLFSIQKSSITEMFKK